ncbi:penicillin-binding protein [Aerococcaceae bacterium DSM 111020]|nr:penicillin-binding protein [Aerococcaceae bacterium DSM 111020]
MRKDKHYSSGNHLNDSNNTQRQRIPSKEEIMQERERRMKRDESINQSTSKKESNHPSSSVDTQQNQSNENEASQNTDYSKTKHPQRRTIHQNKNKKKHLKEKDIVVLQKDSNDKNDEFFSYAALDSSEKISFNLSVFFNVVGRLLLYAAVLIILGGALSAGTGIGYFASLVRNTEPPTAETLGEQLTQYEEQSTLYYADGNPIANVQSDVVRKEVGLDAISDDIEKGLIATEDEYFYEHPGIVPKAIFRAALESLFTQSGTGGSTLTQQLVKQQLLSNEVTFARKANEMLLALRVEKYFDKDDILMAYLNVSPFGRNNRGENIAGIQAAAEGIFGVNASEVNLPQAAFLVGLPQDPYDYTPYTQDGELREDVSEGIERMHEVLFRMYRNKDINQDEYEAAIAYDIQKDFIETEAAPEERSSYLYNAIFNGAVEKIMLKQIEEDGLTREQVWADDALYNDYFFEAEEELRTGGYHVHSTIDKEIYDQLQVSAKEYEDELGVYYDGIYTDPETGEETYYIERVQTGMVVMDNPTGRVLGFVAGTDFENNQIDHAFNMHRSPGSTIKPLAVYAPAVEHNLINPATMIPDTAFVQTFEDGSTWEPTNYGMTMSNENMSARVALYRSDNLPAVRIYEENLRQGVPINDYLTRMGFDMVDSYTEEETQNLAFSLGGVTTGPTVFEQTSAFTTFANNGQYVDGYYIDRIEDAEGNIIFQQDIDPVQVFSEDTNYLMVDMLRDTMAEGTGRTANQNKSMGGDWIAKSGISENSKDVWFLASTPQITIGSWIGYDSRFEDYTINVNDGYGLESIRSQTHWARVVNDLYEKRPDIFGVDRSFQQPASVQRQTVLEQTGTLPGRVTYNGRTISLSQPTHEELFKVSHPAPELTIDFLFNASEEELATFWNAQFNRMREENSRRNNSSSSGQNNDQQSDESSDESSNTSSDSNSNDGNDNAGDGDNSDNATEETTSSADS